MRSHVRTESIDKDASRNMISWRLNGTRGSTESYELVVLRIYVGKR